MQKAIASRVAKLIDFSVQLIERNDTALTEIAVDILEIASEILIELDQPEQPPNQ